LRGFTFVLYFPTVNHYVVPTMRINRSNLFISTLIENEFIVWFVIVNFLNLLLCYQYRFLLFLIFLWSTRRKYSWFITNKLLHRLVFFQEVNGMISIFYVFLFQLICRVYYHWSIDVKLRHRRTLTFIFMSISICLGPSSPNIYGAFSVSSLFSILDFVTINLHHLVFIFKSR
jgi:hypothetical protein